MQDWTNKNESLFNVKCQATEGKALLKTCNYFNA